VLTLIHPSVFKIVIQAAAYPNHKVVAVAAAERCEPTVCWLHQAILLFWEYDMRRLTLALASAALFTVPALAQTATPDTATAPTATQGAVSATGGADMTAAAQSAMEEGGLTDVQPMTGAMVYTATAPGGIPVTVIVGGSGMSGGGAMSTGSMGTTGSGSTATPAPAN